MRRLALLLALAAAFLVTPHPAQSRSRPVRRDPPTLVGANTAFALDLYAQLRGGDGNLVFSPFSISLALGMTSAGAGGDTLAEMQKTLHFADLADPAEAHPGFAAAAKRLGAVKGVELRVANRLYGMKGYPFAKPFLELLRKHYGAELEALDFVKGAGAARKRINAWVEKQTNKKIVDLLPEGSVGALTRLVLVNAIYFKGTWADRFDPAATADGAFTTAKGTTVQAPLMHREGAYRYAAAAGVKLLELPFEGGEVALVVLLPDDAKGLAALEQQLTPRQLEAWLGALQREETVIVTLPRFRSRGKAALSATLAALGMPRAFATERADFSAMTDGPTGERLAISEVHHQAFIAVTEEGAEAAAATAVVIGADSVPPPPPVFQANHPFVYLIRDTRDGHILFMGRVVDPTRE